LLFFFFTSSEQSKISNDVFRDVVHVFFYRGILYLLNMGFTAHA